MLHGLCVCCRMSCVAIITLFALSVYQGKHALGSGISKCAAACFEDDNSGVIEGDGTQV